jgi:hypothetical protein
MKILRIKYSNIGIFKNEFIFDFSVNDRVLDKDEVIEVYNSVRLFKVMSMIGINSSGKTSALKLIKFAMDIVLGGKSLGEINISKGIIKKGTIMTIDFFYNDKFYRLESNFTENKLIIDDNGLGLKYNEEKIYCKNKSEVTSRNMIFYYDENHIIDTREMMKKQENLFIKPTDSIILKIIKDNKFYYTDMIFETNFNLYNIKGEALMAFINLFDNSIKSLKNDRDSLKVVFKNNEIEYGSFDPIKAQNYLSSGTIKGGNLTHKILSVMKNGGYLLVDELEIHMHKQLVITIINFFNDPEINKNNATLIFTTHYAEILDSIDRKDNIYITKKTNDYNCEIVRYSDLINRNDIKKSEIFLANFTGGTAPKYEDIEKVRDILCHMN